MSKKVRKAYGKKGSKGKKHKKIKGTLDKKIRKALKKDIEKTFEVKSVEKAKNNCNHRNKKGDVDVMTVEDLRREQIEFLVPNLQAYIDTFGEENVNICKGCYTPVVHTDLIAQEDVARGMVMLEAMATAVVINSEKEKEIGGYREVIKTTQKTARFVSKRYNKVIGKTVKKDQKSGSVKFNTGGSKEM